MNEMHLHLVGAHVPVVALPGCLLWLALAVWRGDRWWIRLTLVMVLAVSGLGIAVQQTGEMALEMWAGLDDPLRQSLGPWEDVGPHADWGERAALVLFLNACLAATGLWLSRGGRPVDRRVLLALGLGLILGCGVLGWTAALGGRIRHPEARPTWTTAPSLEPDAAN